LLIAVCAIGSAVIGGQEEPPVATLPPPQTQTPTPAPTPTPTRTPATGAVAATATATATATDPATATGLWSTASPELLALYQKVRGGARVSNAERGRLFAMAIQDRDDPRPQIVLAYHYANFGARSDAIIRYQKAVAANPAARADPRMRTDLESFAQHRDPSIARAARQALREIYGP
jgi:hypothetical protein